MELNWETSDNPGRFSEFMVSTSETEESLILGVLLGVYISINFLF